MNRLTNGDRCRVLACLVEGNSIRATVRKVTRQRDALLEACRLNAERMESAIETLNQRQPGMPMLPSAWREFSERQFKAAAIAARQAIKQAEEKL